MKFKDDNKIVCHLNSSEYKILIFFHLSDSQWGKTGLMVSVFRYLCFGDSGDFGSSGIFGDEPDSGSLGDSDGGGKPSKAFWYPHSVRG